jgi:Alpha/beta hydrolase domain
MVTFCGPVTAGTITKPASMLTIDLTASGYVEEEFLAEGTASGFDLTGEAGPDGRWTARPAEPEPEPYRTRVLVRRPADPARFSGTVLVEWLNVSSGFEADPDWMFLHPEILRAGHAYLAVSAQAVGVVGGQARLNLSGAPPRGLRGDNPDRYGTLEHPGDRYSFDLFRQLGAAVKEAGPDTEALLGGLRPARVLAIGESQSAIYLTTYINAVQAFSPVFDGFLVHSRGAGAAPLSGEPIDPPSVTQGVRIRDDGPAPVLIVETEGDLQPPLTYRLARQPDSERLRVWEMAGTAHADDYLIGAGAEFFGIGWPINAGPQQYLVRAALRALVSWAAGGTPPPAAPPIGFESEQPPVIARDDAGNALGGVRTPLVDVPAATLSGEGPAGHQLSWLVGQTVPLPEDELVRRYGDRQGYLDAFTESLDATIAAGFVLPEDREALLGQAAGAAFASEPPAA